MANQKIHFDLPQELADAANILSGKQGATIVKRPDGTVQVTLDRGDIDDRVLSKLAEILEEAGITLRY